MPSERVAHSVIGISGFDVIGKDASLPNLICHAGLAKSSGNQSAQAVSVFDMGPPLHGVGAHAQMQADAIASAHLTDDEFQKIKVFVDSHTLEHESFVGLNAGQVLKLAPEMYSILPHAAPLVDQRGRIVRMRYSCAGFVIEAYRFARIQVLDDSSLPLVDFATICAAYPKQCELFNRGMINAAALGLSGNGPWPVLMCGYLFHALNRDADSIRRHPYLVQPHDLHF